MKNIESAIKTLEKEINNLHEWINKSGNAPMYVTIRKLAENQISEHQTAIKVLNEYKEKQ